MAAKSSGIARLLTKHKAAFVKELDLNRVANKLARKGVISKKEEQVLYECGDSKTQAELFVDILSDKNPNFFHEFCGTLEECAPHLLTRFLLDASPGKLREYLGVTDDMHIVTLESVFIPGFLPHPLVDRSADT